MNGASGGRAARIRWSVSPARAPSAPGTTNTIRHKTADAPAAANGCQLRRTGSVAPPVMSEKYGRSPASHTASVAGIGAMSAAAATMIAPSAR